jgi:hypothetical protein
MQVATLLPLGNFICGPSSIGFSDINTGDGKHYLLYLSYLITRNEKVPKFK